MLQATISGRARVIVGRTIRDTSSVRNDAKNSSAAALSRQQRNLKSNEWLFPGCSSGANRGLNYGVGGLSGLLPPRHASPGLNTWGLYIP